MRGCMARYGLQIDRKMGLDISSFAKEGQGGGGLQLDSAVSEGIMRGTNFVKAVMTLLVFFPRFYFIGKHIGESWIAFRANSTFLQHGD